MWCPTQRTFYHQQDLEQCAAPWRCRWCFLQKHGAVEAGLSGSLSDSLAGAWLLYRNLAEMAKLLETGRVLSIGVSNFQIHHLEELKKISGIVPAVNQIECHPLCYPKELIEYCQSEGIQVQAYAPLARGAYLDNDVMCVLGTKYAHTPAQVGLRWAIQKGISVIPKSVNPDRIASNANIFDFNIEDEDMAIMDTLNEDLHTSHVPDDLKDVIF